MQQNKLDVDSSHHVITSVLLDIFCRGVKKTAASNIRALAIAAIALGPFMGLIITIFGKIIPVMVTFGLWSIFSPELLGIFRSREVYFTAAAILIFWQSFMDGLPRLSIDLAVMLSNGHALKWLCNHYLEGSAIAIAMLKSPAFAPVITHYCDAMQIADQSKYAEFLDLANQASNPLKAVEVQSRIDSYLREKREKEDG